jgi:hypothetical protein
MGNMVQVQQRPFGNCPAADFEVHTFSLNSATPPVFVSSDTVGFHITVP